MSVGGTGLAWSHGARCFGSLDCAELLQVKRSAENARKREARGHVSTEARSHLDSLLAMPSIASSLKDMELDQGIVGKCLGFAVVELNPEEVDTLLSVKSL